MDNNNTKETDQMKVAKGKMNPDERIQKGTSKDRTEGILESFSPGDTEKIAEELAKEAHPGSIYALEGDLGCGKTVFAKGFAKGLGIEEEINSPTFTILQRYDGGRLPFFHFDVYRIEDEEEMEEVGWEDTIYGDGVSLIEWPDRIADLLPEDAALILLEKDLEKGTDYRRIRITRWGKR